MTALPATGREWHLVARPHGMPKPSDFALREAEVPTPGPGQALIRNVYLSIDAYMRGMLNPPGVNGAGSYHAPYELNEPMYGLAAGEVLASESDTLAVGDYVLHGLGWREYAVIDAAHLEDAHVTKIDPNQGPMTAYMGVLGLNGLTAYTGLVGVGEIKEGQTVFVSGAAGGTGSLAGQIAKLKGAARVIGSAGSDEKVKLLTEKYGFDAAFNYKNGAISEQLAKAAPDGIDIYFDNVGGDHLDAALESLNVHGRVVLCGLMSQYNATEPPVGPRNLGLVIAKRLRIEGLIVTDHIELQPKFYEEVGGWLASGELVTDETIVTGIDNAADALLGLLNGTNVGKMIVKLD